MNEENLIKIKCPKCNREYLPGEIYLPNDFLGKPIEVERDTQGKIIFNDGLPQCLDSEYICDGCGCKFNIQAELKFTTSISTLDMSEEYASKKYSDRITLKEDF